MNLRSELQTDSTVSARMKGSKQHLSLLFVIVLLTGSAVSCSAARQDVSGKPAVRLSGYRRLQQGDQCCASSRCVLCGRTWIERLRFSELIRH
jgi:hypothetical protein